MHGKGDTMTFDFELQWTGQYTLVLTSTLGLHVTFMFCFFFFDHPHIILAVIL